eukprot:1160979-Pelagomonas_calceolata.AAC.12
MELGPSVSYPILSIEGTLHTSVNLEVHCVLLIEGGTARYLKVLFTSKGSVSMVQKALQIFLWPVGSRLMVTAIS